MSRLKADRRISLALGRQCMSYLWLVHRFRVASLTFSPPSPCPKFTRVLPAKAAALAGQRAWPSRIPGERPASEGSQLPACVQSLPGSLPVYQFASFLYIPGIVPVCLLSCLGSSSPRICSFEQTQLRLSLRTTTHIFLVLAFSNSRQAGLQVGW